MKKLIIFTMYGALTNTPWIDKKPLAPLAGRAEICQELLEKGVRLAIANNDGGVAFGIATEDEAYEKVASIADQLGINYVRVAYGHPNPKAGYEQYADDQYMNDRKPAPGMLISIMKEAKISAKDTIMVGTREEDEQAARAARVEFIWGKDFFGTGVDLLPRVYQLWGELEQVTGRQYCLTIGNHKTGMGHLERIEGGLLCAWPEWKDAILFLEREKQDAILVKDDK